MDDRWDPRKAEANLRKHGVSFEEAETVERDALRWLRPDPAHSRFEDRWLMTGASNVERILTIALTYRKGKMRPISARRATKRERHDYWLRLRRPR